MAKDPYEYRGATPDTFGRSGRVVTPGATDLDPIAKSVVCLTTGDVTIVPVGNDNATTLAFTGLAAGTVIPYQVRRVTAATATVATIDD